MIGSAVRVTRIAGLRALWPRLAGVATLFTLIVESGSKLVEVLQIT